MNVVNMYDLSGKIAIVTGGAAGLGLQMAEGLSEAGADIVIADIKLDAYEYDPLDKLSKNSSGFKVDITKQEEVKFLMHNVEKKYGKIDILVNNAGVAEIQDTTSVDYNEWNRIFDVNVWGVFLCSRTVFPYMKKRNYGKIINIASLYSVVGYDKSIYVENLDEPYDLFSYSGSKGAVASLTRDMSVRWARYGINVNCISPGGFITNQTKNMITDFLRKNFEKRTPIGRFGGEDDLKGPVVFLASDASKFLVGINLYVDGGFLAL
jgi:NAD(P)-dependent dehydrogenase (short-subunit alcohol dehydrogenase family)